MQYPALQPVTEMGFLVFYARACWIECSTGSEIEVTKPYNLRVGMPQITAPQCATSGPTDHWTRAGRLVIKRHGDYEQLLSER